MGERDRVEAYRRRLVAAREELRAVPLIGRGAPGPADPETGERWDRANVLGHVAEMLPYWTAQGRTVLAGAEEFGRDEPGARARRQGIDGGAAQAEEAVRGEIDAGAEGVLELLDDLRDADLDRRATFHGMGSEGTREVTLEHLVDHLLVGHLEAHVRQLAELTP
jgi:hypothetical protein